MTSRYILYLIICLDALILFFQTSQLSISFDEASLLYGEYSFLQLLVNISLNIFGHNDFALRFVMISFHLMSVVLMYVISKRYIQLERNRLWLLLVFILLPGVVSSAIVVNNAGMVIFGLLLFVYLNEKFPQPFINILLFLYSIIDIGFAYLFLGLAIYYLFEKKRLLSLYLIALYIFTSYLYGFDAYGAPKGHFLDTIGAYSAVFSPIIFIYVFYTLYRRYLTGRIDMLWYISSTALILSLVLSFRQRIAIEHFAPYLIIALPLAAATFIHSYRIRLKMFRKRYKFIFVLSFLFLLSNTLIVFFNKEMYALIGNPKNHFTYQMHVAKELANYLKGNALECISTDDKMQLRLKFYAIDYCENNILTEISLEAGEASNVTISYKNSILYRANVTIINNI